MYNTSVVRRIDLSLSFALSIFIKRTRSLFGESDLEKATRLIAQARLLKLDFHQEPLSQNEDRFWLIKKELDRMAADYNTDFRAKCLIEDFCQSSFFKKTRQEIGPQSYDKKLFDETNKIIGDLSSGIADEEVRKKTFDRLKAIYKHEDTPPYLKSYIKDHCIEATDAKA